MKPAEKGSTAAVLATAAPATLAGASSGIAERLRNMAERPASLCVRDVVDRYMARYTGRDNALMARLSTWQVILGDFTLAALDSVECLA